MQTARIVVVLSVFCLAICLAQVVYYQASAQETAEPTSALRPRTRSAYQPWPAAAGPDAQVSPLVERYNELEGRLEQLVVQYRAADSPGRQAALRTQIAELTAEQFDLRQQVRESEIQRLRERLADVEATVAQRKALKDKIVERRTEDLLDEGHELRWEPLVAGGSLGGTRAPSSLFDGSSSTGGRNVPIHVAAPTIYGVTQTAGQAYSPDASADAVAMAETRLKYAREAHSRLGTLAEGGIVSATEQVKAAQEYELARIALDRIKRQFEAHKSLLELDVSRARLELDRAKLEYQDVVEVNARSPGAVAKPRLLQLEIAVREAEAELERATILLDLHSRESSQEEESTN